MNEKLRAFLPLPPGLALLGAFIAHVLEGPAAKRPEGPRS